MPKSRTITSKKTFFKALAASCSTSVRAMCGDLRDCHNASQAMADFLQSSGFTDAAVVGCSVAFGSSAGITQRLGEFEVSTDPAHSVVSVSGYLIDPTAGQFRTECCLIPDYVILSPHIAKPMLHFNFGWVRGEHNRLVCVSRKRRGEDYQIAYVPTNADESQTDSPPERELVLEPVRCAAEDLGVAWGETRYAPGSW